jgi:pilus assembly protein CpaC
MNTNVKPYLVAVWLVARVALAAPGAPAQVPPAPAAKPVSMRSSTVAASASAGHASGATVYDAAWSNNGPVVNGQSLTLYHGEVQVLDLANVSRIAVGDGSVLKATVAEPGQIVLIGQQAGTTTLRVWVANSAQYNYEVRVRNDDTARIVRDVQDLLANEPGVTVRQVDGHVLIEGDYSSSNTAAKIEAIQKIYPQVVSVSPAHKPAATVQIDRMIHMDVRVVEIRKNALDQLGVNWAGHMTGPTLGGSYTTGKFPMRVPNTGYFGIASNLTSMIDLLGQSGDSWTLAEPKVSCKSGGEAKFVVGGEIPIPVSAGLGTTSVVYKKYGIILEFKPVADDKGNVTSSIVAEVSEPDPTFSNVGNNGLIAFRQNRTETEVSLKENETLVISGLLRNNGSAAVNGIPGLKDVPVLGSLFKSKEFQNERTELVVLVTPRAIDPQAELSVAAVKRSDDLTDNANKIINRYMAE